jgi:hypothetical protein
MKLTKTTAKKGMSEYKAGFGKNDYEYGFLNVQNYDEKRYLKEVIETLFGKIDKLEKILEGVIVDRDKFIEQYNELKKEHDRMLLDVKVLSTFTLD